MKPNGFRENEMPPSVRIVQKTLTRFSNEVVHCTTFKIILRGVRRGEVKVEMWMVDLDDFVDFKYFLKKVKIWVGKVEMRWVVEGKTSK